MHILLTGASGYIGLYILRELLSAGYEVTAVVRQREKLGHFTQKPNLSIIEADLVHQDDFSKMLDGKHTLIHSALIWGDPETEFDLLDTRVAAKLFDAAGRVGVQRCVYISAVAVHRPFKVDMNEEQPLLPTDIYGATKAAGELFLRTASANYGMKGVVLRPGPVVGPPAFVGATFRSDRRIQKIVADACGSRPVKVEIGDGRQFTDVIKLANTVLLAVSAKELYETYICVDREILTWEWIAREAIACVGSKSNLILQNPNLVAANPFFSTARIEKLIGKNIDSSKAMSAHIQHLSIYSG